MMQFTIVRRWLLWLVSRVITPVLTWLRAHVSETTILYLAAFAMGLTTGIAAALLKSLINLVNRIVISACHLHSMAWLLLLMPAVGIFVASAWARKVIRLPLERGTTQLRQAIASGNPRLNLRLIPGPIVGCALTLGMGGSAGNEGPIAFSCAALGSAIGRVCNFARQETMIMLASGAGAGIAGIFMAPMAGVFFTLEVLRMKMTTTTVMTLCTACLTAALTCFALLGCHIDMPFDRWLHMEWHYIPKLILLGCVCGIYSIYYIRTNTLSKKLFLRMKSHWTRNLIAGSTVALLVILFPMLWGDGHNVMSALVDGNAHIVYTDSLWSGFGRFNLRHHHIFIPLILILILAVKGYATAATNTGGGVGGEYTPLLFCGCLLGMFFSNMFVGGDEFFTYLSVYGMAGVLAGVVRAPFMAIFLTMEMTGNFHLFLPITIVVAISFAWVHIYEKRHDLKEIF